MTSSSAWLHSRIAPTPEDLANGDGSHPDEVKTLIDYLNDSITSEEAAEKIVTPIRNEVKPADETYRLWGLLCDALVELSDKEDRRKTLKLLTQIRTLPPSHDIDWSQLPGLTSMWSTQYCSHLYGSDPPGIRLAMKSPDEQKVRDFQERYDSIGRAEATMFVRGFNGFTSEDCGYDVLDLALSDRPGLDIYMGQIFAWLDVAGLRLKEKAEQEESLREKWAQWKEALLKLSQKGSGLSDGGKRLAAQIYDLM